MPGAPFVCNLVVVPGRAWLTQLMLALFLPLLLGHYAGLAFYQARVRLVLKRKEALRVSETKGNEKEERPSPSRGGARHGERKTRIKPSTHP